MVLLYCIILCFLDHIFNILDLSRYILPSLCPGALSYKVTFNPDPDPLRSLGNLQKGNSDLVLSQVSTSFLTIQHHTLAAGVEGVSLPAHKICIMLLLPQDS